MTEERTDEEETLRDAMQRSRDGLFVEGLDDKGSCILDLDSAMIADGV